jgi:hypothetical protein
VPLVVPPFVAPDGALPVRNSNNCGASVALPLASTAIPPDVGTITPPSVVVVAAGRDAVTEAHVWSPRR